MTRTRTAGRALARGIDSPAFTLALWSCVALVAAAQAVAVARLDPHIAIGAALSARLSILPLWALATPIILRSARRFPVIGAGSSVSLAHLALHALCGTLFIVMANVAIRVPDVIFGSMPASSIGRSTMMGLAEFFPFALIVYALIVAAGHVQRAAAGEPSLDATPHAAAADPAPIVVPEAVSAAPECLTIHQWNRVHLVRTVDIDWIEAEDNYVVVHAAGKRYKGRERIGDVESRLDPLRFVRIHRSAIVHVGRIKEVQPLTHGDHAVVLHDGKVLRVARSRRRALGTALAIEL